MEGEGGEEVVEVMDDALFADSRGRDVESRFCRRRPADVSRGKRLSRGSGGSCAKLYAEHVESPRSELYESRTYG
jgi:hypothetical protein